MSQIKKLTDVEVSEIRAMQEKHHGMTMKLGNLQIEKMELDRLVGQFVETETKLKEEWKTFQQLDRNLASKMSEKYGNGKINLDDWTFISNESTVAEEQRKV